MKAVIDNKGNVVFLAHVVDAGAYAKDFTVVDVGDAAPPSFMASRMKAVGGKLVELSDAERAAVVATESAAVDDAVYAKILKRLKAEGKVK